MARAADPRSARAGYVLPRFQPRSCETVDCESRVIFEFQPGVGTWLLRRDDNGSERSCGVEWVFLRF